MKYRLFPGIHLSGIHNYSAWMWIIILISHTIMLYLRFILRLRNITCKGILFYGNNSIIVIIVIILSFVRLKAVLVGMNIHLLKGAQIGLIALYLYALTMWLNNVLFVDFLTRETVVVFTFPTLFAEKQTH